MPKNNDESARLKKRKDFFNEIVNENDDINIKTAVNNLSTMIGKYQSKKKKLGMEDVDKLIKAYEQCAVGLKKAHDAARNVYNNRLAEYYQKLMKKFAKDYAALFRYKKHLEKNPADDKKLTIDGFFDASRTRTISIGGKSLKEMDKVGAGMSARYKIPITIEDEPVEGVDPGETYFGFFTENAAYDDALSDDELPIADDIKIGKMLGEKYPQFADKMKADLEEGNCVWYPIAMVLNRSNADSTIRLNPERLFVLFSHDEILDLIKDYINDDQELPENSKNEVCKADLFPMIDELKALPAKEKKVAVHALVEYCCNMGKAEFGRDVMKGASIDLHSSVGQRNALMSSMADILGCSEVLAFSEKVNVKAVEDGKVVTKKGVIMMPASGEDSCGFNLKGGFVQMDAASAENSPGLIKSIASLQFLDYICGNTDRHAGNYFYKFNKDGKLVAVVGIDNDNSFIGSPDYEQFGHAIAFTDLKVIPKSMADIVTNMSSDTFAMMMYGYGVNRDEMYATIKKFEDVKKALKESEKTYKDVVPGHLIDNVPRIVPDEELDTYSVNEQLATRYEEGTNNIFSTVTENDKRANLILEVGYASDDVLKDAYKLDDALIEKSPGSLSYNVDKMGDFINPLFNIPNIAGLQGADDEIDEKTRAAINKMKEATEELLTDTIFEQPYVKKADVDAEDQKVYEFKLALSPEDQNTLDYAIKNKDNPDPKAVQACQEAAKIDWLRRDKRYVALNKAYEATQEYLVEYADVGMKYQELQEDVELAKTNEAKQNAIKALTDYKKTNACKQYLTAVENKNRLTEQMKTFVDLYDKCNELLDARDKVNDMDDPEVYDTYEGSEMQQKAIEKVEALKQEQQNRVNNANKGMHV